MRGTAQRKQGSTRAAPLTWSKLLVTLRTWRERAARSGRSAASAAGWRCSPPATSIFTGIAKAGTARGAASRGTFVASAGRRGRSSLGWYQTRRHRMTIPHHQSPASLGRAALPCRKTWCLCGARDVRHNASMADDPRTLSDHDLPAAYQASGGEPGDPVADALAAEIERRNLDL